MQEQKIEPILAVKDHGGVFDGVLGSSTFAPIMADIERMMQEKRTEPIVAVEDHGGLFDTALIFGFGLLENTRLATSFLLWWLFICCGYKHTADCKNNRADYENSYHHRRTGPNGAIFVEVRLCDTHCWHGTIFSLWKWLGNSLVIV